jgi:hypothetical protein
MSKADVNSINDPLITHITIQRVSLFGNQTSAYRFIFYWSQKHWKENYRELSQLENIFYFHLKEWTPIFHIIEGKNSLSYALLLLNNENSHIGFVAKLLIIYGIESVVFHKEN